MSHPASLRPGPAWFVCGTDTGVGKSLVSAALLHALQARHARVVGMKPVAAGSCVGPDGQRSNDDIEALRAASTLRTDARLDNPYLLDLPASPHIAAAQESVQIELDVITQACAELRRQADAVVVEGAGGALVPLAPGLDGGDLMGALRLPVILVVGLRLGALNHATLTAEAIAARGLRLAGYVVNQIDPDMQAVEANLQWLGHVLGGRFAAPCLGVLPFADRPDPRAMAGLLSLPRWAEEH